MFQNKWIRIDERLARRPFDDRVEGQASEFASRVPPFHHVG
jgi:hypothetical protein